MLSARYICTIRGKTETGRVRVSTRERKQEKSPRDGSLCVSLLPRPHPKKNIQHTSSDGVQGASTIGVLQNWHPAVQNKPPTPEPSRSCSSAEGAQTRAPNQELARCAHHLRLHSCLRVLVQRRFLRLLQVLFMSFITLPVVFLRSSLCCQTVFNLWTTLKRGWEQHHPKGGENVASLA